MAYTTINKSSEHFNSVAYTGGSGDTAHTVGFQPDLVWIKERTRARNHAWFDSIRGSRRWIGSNSSGAEDYNAGAYLASFNSNGFTTTDTDVVGKNGLTYASWNWKAGATQTLGGGATATVKANTTSGFSIVSWTGTAGNILVSHGLGAVPKMIIVKNRSITQEWAVYHASLGGTKYLELNQTGASGSASNRWNSSNPDATHFIVSSDASVNGSGNSMIAYCFAEKQGFSKFGSYLGNGNANGTFVYTGFKPAFVMLKNTTDASDWNMKDSKRPGFNQVNDILYPNLNNAEEHGGDIDILSNGFKIRTTAANTNNSGSTYIYMSFAEAPLVGTNGVTAKAR